MKAFNGSCPVKTLLQIEIHLKDTPRAFSDFKNKQKSVWSNVFWYIKAYIFWKYIQYTIPWDKTQLLKNFTSKKKKKNFTNNTLFFLSIAPTHHCFIFGLRLIYELKHSSRFVSLRLCVRFSNFDFISFLLKFTFLFNKKHVKDFLALKRHTSFQIENNRKATHSFTPRPLILKQQQEVLKLNDISVNWSSPKTDLEI